MRLRAVWHEILGLRVENQIRRIALVLRYDPNQPRDERGRWTETDGGAEASSEGAKPSNPEAIISAAGQLNLSSRSDGYQRCLDLCYPLLERFQPPGSDRNTRDFHKCMNICLGEAR